MFQSDDLVYIQMQKTGCTHIAGLLAQLFDGRQIGKHNPADERQIAVGGYFVSSIRNPWDWYLSLWTYGAQGNGGLMRRLTRRNPLRPVAAAVRQRRVGELRNIVYEMTRDVALWRAVYTDSEDVTAFRQWLRHIHDPAHSRALGEGYGSSAVAGFCGFMTYRYLSLCCRNRRTLYRPGAISHYADLERFERDNGYIDFFIRQEQLEDDLCEAVEKVRPLTEAERQRIYGARKTNRSRRRLSLAEYYDEASIELIRSRDRLLVDKFDYSPPGA